MDDGLGFVDPSICFGSWVYPLYQLGSSAASQAKKLHEAEVEEAIEVLVEEELGMNPTFGEGLPTMLPCDW